MGLVDFRDEETRLHETKMVEWLYVQTQDRDSSSCIAAPQCKHPQVPCKSCFHDISEYHTEKNKPNTHTQNEN